jgi:hypothetical protein
MPRRPRGWVEVYLYHFMTSAYRWGVGGQHHAPAALPPGKNRYPLYRRLGGPQSRSGRVRKISPTPGFDLRTVQPVASRYTDWAIPAPYWRIYIYIYYVWTGCTNFMILGLPIYCWNLCRELLYMDYLWFYINCVHLLVFVCDCSHSELNEWYSTNSTVR